MSGSRMLAGGLSASQAGQQQRGQGLRLVFLLAAASLAGCSSLGPRLILDRPGEVAAGSRPPAADRSRSGGYYKDDGPGANPPDIAAIPDAEPRIEPLHRFANNPYNVFGVPYTPQRALAPFRQRGVGSWYGRKFHGQKTSSGETYDMYAMTAAHPTLPIPSYARITRLGTGRSVIVRVNDRGPFRSGRIVDLSYAAAWKLDYIGAGSAQVEVELLTPDHIAALGRNRKAPATEAAGLGTADPPDAVATIALNVVAPPEAQLLQPAVAEATPAAEAHAGEIFLQLAAFSGRDNAETFRARLQRELNWLTDAIHILQRDGLFRLRLGPYRDRTEAGSMAERIRAALQLNPMIVVR